MQPGLDERWTLAVSDMVRSAHGEILAKVQRKIPHDDQQAFEVRVEDLRTRATPSHRVSIPTGGMCPQGAMAKD